MNTTKRKPSAALSKILSSISEEDKRHTRDRMLVAVKIADALEAKKLSQKRFAELMGKSESEISEWLSGNRNFTIDTLSDIGDCLGISLLPNSDMRIKRVSTQESHIKIAKTRNPRPYVLSGEQLFNHSFNDWKHTASSNLVLCSLA